MKYLSFILFLLLSFNFVYSQETIESKQFMIGIKNVGNQVVVDHTIVPIGAYWEFDNGNWIVSSDPAGETSTIPTVGNSDFNNLGGWDGWNWFWLNNTDPPNKDWGLGFYKVTNDYNSEYFYLDGRVNAWGDGDYGTPDFWVHLDAGVAVYKYDDNPTPVWNPIQTGEIVRIWDVHGVSPPSSNSLGNFWSNVLVLINGGGNHPRFAWGPHPSFSTTDFYIYRAVSTIPPDYRNLTYNLIGITNSTTYEFIDNEISFDESFSNSAFYYVKAYNSSSSNYSSASNTVLTYGEYSPQKISEETPDGIQVDKFELTQNYPNPFNPSTIIQYSIKNKSFATLKIYDILGNEVAVLLNEVVEAGNHSVEFFAKGGSASGGDAYNLASGIYIYRLTAGDFTASKKLILLK